MKCMNIVLAVRSLPNGRRALREGPHLPAVWQNSENHRACCAVDCMDSVHNLPAYTKLAQT